MRKLICKVFILAVINICIATLMFFISGSQFQGDYNASIIDKIARLKELENPKIILAGNSNLSFGIKSDLIEDALNMPVVNLGLHGGLGNIFHENMAKLNISSGDIVIIAHSDYEDDGSIGDAGLAWITIEHHIALYDLIPSYEYWHMLKALPKYIIKSSLRWLIGTGNQSANNSYARKAFNKYGDVIYKPESGRFDAKEYFKKNKPEVPGISSACIKRLNKLNEYCKRRGAMLFIAGYPIASGPDTPPAKEYIKFQDKLKSLLDCKVISNYHDYFIDYKYFYDTKFHLDYDGAKIRTEQLIKDLKNNVKY